MTLIEASQILCVLISLISAIVMMAWKGVGVLWGLILVVLSIPVGLVAGILLAVLLMALLSFADKRSPPP